MHNSIKLKTLCPECRNGSIVFEGQRCTCWACGVSFPVSDGRPVLIRHSNQVFPPESYVNGSRRGETSSKWTKYCPARSVNLSRTEKLCEFVNIVKNHDAAFVLIIGAGRQQTTLDQIFSRAPNVILVYSDIDADAPVDCICDGHDIPFDANTFQGVIATAVLEHVLYPERVVSEIHRVLAPGGIVYSEIPFMQQVHEGAYDFKRYTLSGHRHLFRSFRELSSGVVAGPGTALVWAIENIILCFAVGSLSRNILKAGTRFIFSWIKYFDYIFKNHPQAIDGASCTYFLGQKESGYGVSDISIIREYNGAQRHHRGGNGP